jgi:hypothetical protein
MEFLEKTDRFSYFDKKFDLIQVAADDNTLVFNI